MKNSTKKTLQIFTIGHSNRSFEDFLALLRKSNIEVVADIRRYPSSRKFPHFNREVLRKLLEAENIKYLWLQALGGRRYSAKKSDSPNIGLKSIGFRNYADHMSTDRFHTTVQELLSTAEKLPTAIMCAEKFYWKCHRRLLSDYLAAQDIEVLHIIEADKIVIHKLTPGAIVTADTKVIYPQDTQNQTGLNFEFTYKTQA